jgi:hypothetical protein
MSSRTSSTEIISEEKNPLSLTEKFIRGLEDYGFTLEAFNEANFKYHGGDTETNHKNYWKMLEGTNPFPEKTNECVCGHYIKRNFYICSKNDIMILGSCCILKFVPSGLRRTCQICGEVHRNRKNNLCNGCREGRCVKCGELCLKSNYKYCKGCFRPNVARWYRYG